AIAVLPFVTFSRNRDDQFFSDGLTEELLNVLSKLKNLRVTARTSSFAYKGVNKNIQDIGRELNVDTILEGSVRRNDVDATIRVTAQLIEVETGAHVWSQTFDREYRDVFKIQDEIAAAVVNQLKVTLLDEEHASLTSRSSANPEAMMMSSMGRAELAKRTGRSLVDAVRFFEKAIEADPLSADAYAGLAKAHALLFGFADDPNTELRKAQAAANKAVDLDETSAEAWAAQGLINMQRSENQAAMDALQKAMSLNPSHAMAHMWYGSLLDDEDQKRTYHARAFELDPRSPVAGYNVATNLIHAGRESEAMDVVARVIDADPYYPLAYELVGRINEFRGRLDEAIQYYRRAYELDQHGHIAQNLAGLYIDIGDFESADEWITAAEAHTPKPDSGLRWVRISALVAHDGRLAAEPALQQMLLASATDVDALMNVAMANYFLDRPDGVIAAWASARDLPDWNERWILERFPEAAIGAAHAYAVTQRGADSAAILDTLDSWLNEKVTTQTRVSPDLWFVKAQVAAIRGQPNRALIHLQRAMDEGWRQHWRPAVEPCLAELLELASFQSMMAGLATRMDLMREQLAFDASFAD
ncbi:MAG: hypothetical protein OES38_17935, partial [Gammaproteobacteria bacterium]|nr:hypothetical protein [Gammaproteobacteria bacterium]